jgi:hypothetical protein
MENFYKKQVKNWELNPYRFAPLTASKWVPVLVYVVVLTPNHPKYIFLIIIIKDVD